MQGCNTQRCRRLAQELPLRIMIHTDNPDGMAWSPLRAAVLTNRQSANP